MRLCCANISVPFMQSRNVPVISFIFTCVETTETAFLISEYMRKHRITLSKKAVLMNKSKEKNAHFISK